MEPVEEMHSLSMAVTTISQILTEVDSDPEKSGVEGNLGRSLAGAQWDRLSKKMIAACGTTVVFAVIFNLWVLYVGLSKKSLRESSFHILLLSHTLLNLLLSVFSYPSLIYRLVAGLPKNLFENKVCDYSSICLVCFLSIGLLTHACIGINRALSCHPQSRISIVGRGKKATGLVLAAMWLVCCAVYVITASLHPLSWTDTFMCTRIDDVIVRAILGKRLSNPRPAVDIVSDELASLAIIAAIICAASYGAIVHYLLLQKKSQDSAQRRKDKKRALGIIVLSFAVFLACWLPLMLVLMEDPFVISTTHIYVYLPILESALNPLLYILTMPVFRPVWWMKRSSNVVQVTVHSVQDVNRTTSMSETGNKSR